MHVCVDLLANCGKMNISLMLYGHVDCDVWHRDSGIFVCPITITISIRVGVHFKYIDLQHAEGSIQSRAGGDLVGVHSFFRQAKSAGGRHSGCATQTSR